jgi:hypothetical protein
MQLKPEFYEALKDYLLLMEKGYPQKATLKLISDRYLLNSVERSILFRGVVVKEKVDFRRTKTINEFPGAGIITIDGFNVLRTIASYLLGRPVYVAMDGFLRDASELHGKPLGQEWRMKAFRLVLEVLKQGDYTLNFWFDTPVTKSGETAAFVNEILNKEAISGKAQTAHSVDYQLKQVEEGIIATADSAIVEHSKVQVIDLAQLVLKKHFNPYFFYLTI